MAELAISIVNHNSVDPLRRCLRSVMESTADLGAEIYVIDNLCEQPACAMVRAEFPSVRVLENSHTLGFGANHNQVLRRTVDRCEYVLLVNPDTVLPPVAIHRMVDYLAAHPAVAICGPQLVDEAGAVTPPLRKFLSLPREALYLSMHLSNANPSPSFWALLNRVAGLAQRTKLLARKAEGITDGDGPAPSGEQLRQAVSGACMLVRTASLHEIGLFDERFFLYFEEIDLCLRAWRHGWQVAFLPDAEVMHIGAYSTAPRYHAYQEVYVQSCLYLYRKHRGFLAAQSLRAWISTVALANTLRWSWLYALQPQRRSDIAPWLTLSAHLVRGLRAMQT
jgi:hypothetical protein